MHIRMIPQPEKIRELRRRLGLTQAGFAGELEVKQSTISRWESGREVPNIENVLAISALMERHGLAPAAETVPRGGAATVPVVGYIGAGQEVFPIDDHALGEGMDQTDSPPDSSSNMVCALVRGDSNYPFLQDGYRVFWDSRFEGNVEHLLGQPVVVKLADERMMIKILRRGPRRGRYNLESYNAPLMEDLEIEWAAPVAWIQPHSAR